MAHEQLRSSTTRALADVVGDVSNLLRKELQLAKTELSVNISAKLQGGVWIAVAAGLAGLALFLLLQAIVFGIASYGVALHWSCLMVAGATAVLAGIAFVAGRADADRPLMPERTIHQIQQDVILSKEQLT